ncbi:MAG: PD-(D/E)XK nuclease family protein, partial [Lachnospiraceae bacterium]|nr:PD-(D/E)XK nuclease family protein [Lachnospiraceae bacterium]
KASEKLFVTYHRLDSSGASARKSYIVSVLEGLFSSLKAKDAKILMEKMDYISTYEECKNRFVELCHELKVRGVLEEDKLKIFHSLLSYMEQYHKEDLSMLLEGIFFTFENDAISQASARVLNGREEFRVSASKLEKYAECAYRYFLQYGLRLRERREHAFESYDIGNIYHEALNRFSSLIRKDDKNWAGITEDEAKAYLRVAIKETLETIEKTEVYEKEREKYIIHRIEETLKRTVWAIMHQVRQGKYEPKYFEVEIQELNNGQALSHELKDHSHLRLDGVVDRLDTYQNEDRVYVKILDYKSGKKELDYVQLYYGLQIQLVYYMGACVEGLQTKMNDKEVLPGAMLYYHLDNPFVEVKKEAEIEDSLLKELRPTGCINDKEESLEAIDKELLSEDGKDSLVCHIRTKKNRAGLHANSQTLSQAEFEGLISFVKDKVVETGEKILDGDISVSPYKYKDRSGCDYCPYHGICGFEAGLEGYNYNKLDSTITKDNVLEKMIKETREDENNE